MKIAICDDEKHFVEYMLSTLKPIINQYNKYNFEFEYFCYTDSITLIKEHKQKMFDIVFLDIDMPYKNGLNIGDDMFLINENIIIFYVTSHENYLFESIKHRVYRFIKKGDRKELIEGINSLLKDLAVLHSRYVFNFKNKTYSLPISSILYFESHRNKISIHTGNGIYEQTTTIKHLTECLPSIFCQCHASFIANINAIQEIKKDNVILKNNEAIPLSRKYRLDVIERLTNNF